MTVWLNFGLFTTSFLLVDLCSLNICFNVNKPNDIQIKMDILRMSSDEGDPCVRKFLASASELQDQTDPAKTFHNARGWLIKKYVYDGRDILTLWCVISESASRGAQDGYPYDVTVTRKENEGFGFVIISSVTRAGSVIGEFICL